MHSFAYFFYIASIITNTLYIRLVVIIKLYLNMMKLEVKAGVQIGLTLLLPGIARICMLFNYIKG